MPEVRCLREDIKLDKVVMVGERGMISQKAIDEMRAMDGIGWITTLKGVSIRSLVEQGHFQFNGVSAGVRPNGRPRLRSAQIAPAARSTGGREACKRAQVSNARYEVFAGSLTAQRRRRCTDRPVLKAGSLHTLPKMKYASKKLRSEAETSTLGSGSK